MTYPGPPGPYPPLPPSAARQRRKRWPWIVGGLVALFVLGLAVAPRSASPTGPTVVPVQTVPARAVTDREWQLIAKAPDQHTGERIIVHGEVFQFDAATGAESFLADVAGVEAQPGGSYPDRVAMAGDKGLLGGIVKGDRFTAEVTVRKAINYATQEGGQATVPGLWVTALQVTRKAS